MSGEKRSLQGQVALVTGAGRGLGRRVAQALASAGAAVALVSRSESDLREAERAIAGAGAVAGVFTADVSDPQAVQAMAEAVERDLGPVSILVNAAGIFGPIAMVKDSDPREWMRTLSVNLIGPYLVCRALVGGMMERRFGRIVNFSSAAALHPVGPLNSAYATSKVALNQFTRHLAAEVTGTGVTANVIHPGDVKTEMWADIRRQASELGPRAEVYRQWVDWVEQTGGDDPAKAAELVLRIVSGDDAANGQFLWIDRGLQTPIPSW
jgi:NAD(P)-dependent dehydrogenase (short-subunit alcohol dehydrogenase family)